ncbi:hypothetical protein [Anoxynatronum buryatiense]|uniref:Uncharacterized protein n=1 Tax=Anoxynatronum buryatiense TaxID=489973 RepID=A0AA45WXI8_9CLOT|nr:hypothetical protein [Anoxynatronum buryatiense]SMP64285.1 hypothetical protein SAMN06296020_111126 [Anoxynatronum buryatiense]
MKKCRTLLIISLTMIMVLMTACTKETAYEDITYELLTYEEAPIYLQERIDAILLKVENGEMSGSIIFQMEASDGKFAVIVPPKDSVTEVQYVGEDETIGWGMMFRYTHLREEDGEAVSLRDKVTVIKINHYQGALRGVFVSSYVVPG